MSSKVLAGKAISDLTFPFSLTLLSDEVAGGLEVRAPSFGGRDPPPLRLRHDLGDRTVVNALRAAEVWTTAADMSEFNRRIPPGRDLNIILLFYEVPIRLNDLVFQPSDWRR